MFRHDLHRRRVGHFNAVPAHEQRARRRLIRAECLALDLLHQAVRDFVWPVWGRLGRWEDDEVHGVVALGVADLSLSIEIQS